MRSPIRIAAVAIILIGGIDLTLPSTASAFQEWCQVCIPAIMCPEFSEGQQYCSSSCGPSWAFEGCNFNHPCGPSTQINCRWNP